MGLKLEYRFFELPLAHPFSIARYTVVVQKTAVVCITDGVQSGYGEATVNPYYHSTVERLTASFNRVALLVADLQGLTPESFWNALAPHLAHDQFALCAIDMAYWDWYARKNGRSVRSYFNAIDTAAPKTSYTIAIDSIEKMKAKILEKPWPIYKIKLGTADDLKIVEGLRNITHAVFRVDANAAWNAKQAIAYSKTLKDFDVEFIEQPLPAADIEGMRELSAKSYLPLIADESCQQESDVEACDGLFDGINIKLMKCGGITPALRMISDAKRRGLLLMAGCMTESSVGISGLAQIAPFLDYLDADGALLLRRDIADGVRFDFGTLQYPDRPGTGVNLSAFQSIKC